MDIYPTQSKHCPKCDISKLIIEFNKNKSKSDGLGSHCKSCIKQHQKNSKETIAVKQKEYYINNKDKISKYQKEYKKNNKSTILPTYKKDYRKKNKDKISKYQKEYIKNRKSIDPLFNLTCGVRSLIGMAIKNKGYTKNSKTYEIIGCSYEEFKTHIEKQFLPCMSWDNRALWHLDHIIPISSGKTELEINTLNHYSNFQPLWAIDNLKKGNKINFVVVK